MRLSNRLYTCFARLNDHFSYANFNAFMNCAFSTHSRFNSLNVRRAPKLTNFCNTLHLQLCAQQKLTLSKKHIEICLFTIYIRLYIWNFLENNVVFINNINLIKKWHKYLHCKVMLALFKFETCTNNMQFLSHIYRANGFTWRVSYRCILPGAQCIFITLVDKKLRISTLR